MALLEVRGITKILLGPSGCGKTTLLTILGGYLAAEAGRSQNYGSGRKYERNV